MCERKSKGGWKPSLPFEPRLSTENNIVKAITDHCNVLTTTLREIVIEPSTWFESFHLIYSRKREGAEPSLRGNVNLVLLERNI